MKLIPTPPEPDFRRYTCSASIDFVTVFHPTHVNLPIDSNQGNICCELGQGRSTTLHDLSPDDLDAVSPHLGDAQIIKLEVSLDFRVRGNPDDAERERLLHEVGDWLLAHLYPWSAPGIQVGHRVSRCKGRAEKIVRPSGDITSARTGDTLYLGHSDSTYANRDQPNFASMRFYVKKTDDKRAVTSRRWSARVEVTLTREGCEHFGLGTLDDLRGFNFRKLSKYFRMVRPSFTLGTPKRGRKFDPPLQAAIEAWVAKFLAERVNDAGAWSLHDVNFATPSHERNAAANRHIGVTLSNLSRKFALPRKCSAEAAPFVS
ncbi:MAG: hypothetical protein U1D69_12535 [Polynucleobacter sp.]|nr:hypothetical protein [Polynucleobacter sp.]